MSCLRAFVLGSGFGIAAITVGCGKSQPSTVSQTPPPPGVVLSGTVSPVADSSGASANPIVAPAAGTPAVGGAALPGPLVAGPVVTSSPIVTGGPTATGGPVVASPVATPAPPSTATVPTSVAGGTAAPAVSGAGGSTAASANAVAPGGISGLPTAVNQWRAQGGKLAGVKRLDDKPVLAGYSWMVNLLPYLGHNDLYGKFDFAKGWHDVALFNNYADYKDFSTRLSSELINAAGFYLPERNISFFFDHGSSETFKELNKLAGKLKDVGQSAVKAKARNAKDIVRLAKTIDLLIEIDRESHDIEVVSHEATHQMAANTGLFPHHVRVPSWVHEGLAAYFESPNDGAWSGIGAVNELRIRYYRALEPDRVHSSLDFIVGDQIFDYAASLGATLHGYGQAWALTHFLVEKHFDQLMGFYKALGELPPDINFNPEVLNAIFDRTFGGDRQSLDQEWRSYMRSLKTDTEEVLGAR